MHVNWQGVFPAITTQFRPDQSLDLTATAMHLDVMIRAGIHGVVFLGTVGENTALEYEEKLAILKEMKQVVGGRIPMLTGVAEYTSALACRFARDAEKIGMDGLMVLPAMVYKSDDRETLAHYRAVCGSNGLPVMAYNNPVSYSVDIAPEMFQQLEDVVNLVAIKESSENVRRITDLVNVTGNRYILFGGVDDLVLESILLGAPRLDFGPGERVPRRKSRAVGPGEGGPVGPGARPVPLVHTAAAPGHQGQTGAIHQAGRAGDRSGFRDGAAAASAHCGRRTRGDPGRHPSRHPDAPGAAGGGMNRKISVIDSHTAASRRAWS